MKALVFRELKSVFCSPVGAFFALAYLLIMGTMLWAFGGGYNLIDRGYSDMEPFFALSAVLLAVLIPALTMRQFSDEKRTKTLDILRSRPVLVSDIYISKFLASFVFVATTLISTTVYVYSLFQLSNPVGNIDIECIFVSYLSLILLVSVFISIGLFASAITKNQIVALILAVALCLFLFFGFELAASLFQSGKTQAFLSSLGLVRHYELMQRGVIESGDLLAVLNYIFVFVILALLILGQGKYKLIVATFVLLNTVLLFIPDIRFDFTADKRHTLNDYTKNLLRDELKDGTILKIDVWLDGDLNAGFQHLQDAVKNTLTDFDRHASEPLIINYRNPYLSFKGMEEMYQSMAESGMPGITLNEMDREGKASQKIIYPYAQISDGKDTLVVSFLKNIKGYSADENLNASVEGLEFEFVDAIRLLRQKERKDIAFIEGHGEVGDVYTYDAENILSKYYFVHRGEITNQVGVLDDFEAIIIAGPTGRYIESEKYVIDQYIMSGGKVLWLLDGAYYSSQDLKEKGHSASMKNDANLDDLLFTYGVRVNPDYVQDQQCAFNYLIAGDNSQSATSMPCFYIPFLIPSPDNIITKDMRHIRIPFVSSVDVVNNNSGIDKKVLLTSSANAHLMSVPEPINFDISEIQNQENYFDQSYIPVGISLEGEFVSGFDGRMIPDSIDAKDKAMQAKSKKTRMIVVGSSGIIKNEIEGSGENSQFVPMGYDRVLGQQFGNQDFIINAVNWLADNDGWMLLRNKQQQLRILNKKEAYENRNMYAAMNILIPLLFMVLVMGGMIFYRKRKYEQ